MALNKIHVNSSTKISLNDRFTIMQTYAPPATGGGAGGKAKGSPKASAKNRQLVSQLEKQHKIMAAMKLKRKSLRQNRGANLKNAANMLNIAPRGGGNMRRSNSLKNLTTMRADLMDGSRIRPARIQRSNSTSNIAARLGNRRNSGASGQNVGRGGGRRRINRANSFSNMQQQHPHNLRNRSLSRSNSKTNLQRSNSQVSLRQTANSNASFNRRGRQQQAPANNRKRVVAVRKRSNSVNNRLGNRTNPPIRGAAVAARRGGGRLQGRIGTKPIVRGRVFRRSNSAGISQNMNAGQMNNMQNRSRSRSRTRAQTAAAAGNRNQSANRGGGGGGFRGGRSRSRSRQNVKNNAGGGVVPAGRGRPRRNSVGRGRGGNQGRGGRAGSRAGSRPATPVKSREELDSELDQYMAKTKSHLDMDLDTYMKTVN